jgi:hypothetical protein
MLYTFSFLIAGAALTMSAPNASAQGRYSAALRTILTRTASGTCPADMMQAKLLKACRQQIAKSGPPLASKGTIKALNFIKATHTADRTEFYKVFFTKGNPEIWLIGGLESGKFAEFYTDDE